MTENKNGINILRLMNTFNILPNEFPGDPFQLFSIDPIISILEDAIYIICFTEHICDLSM